MARIQGFTAPSAIRSSDQGFSAFETYGRRVAGQFDQAANDIREIGRSKAAVTNMLGRWPLNIIDLEQRAQAEADKRNQAQGQGPAQFRMPGSTKANFNVVRPERGLTHNSGVDSAGSRGGSSGHGGGSPYDQMSEGAGRLGSMLGGHRGAGTDQEDTSGNVRTDRAAIARQDRETKRYNDMIDAMNAKDWALYERNLDKHNENLQNWASQPVYSEGNPYPVNQPVSTTNNPDSTYYRYTGKDYGGAGDPTYSTDYGGSGSQPSTSWFTYNNAFAPLAPQDPTPAAESGGFIGGL